MAGRRMSVTESLRFSIEKDDPEWAPRVAGRVSNSWKFLKRYEKAAVRKLLKEAILKGGNTWLVWAELRDSLEYDRA